MSGQSKGPPIPRCVAFIFLEDDETEFVLENPDISDRTPSPCEVAGDITHTQVQALKTKLLRGLRGIVWLNMGKLPYDDSKSVFGRGEEKDQILPSQTTFDPSIALRDG